jgi:hypothetical protein
MVNENHFFHQVQETPPLGEVFVPDKHKKRGAKQPLLKIWQMTNQKIPSMDGDVHTLYIRG